MTSGQPPFPPRAGNSSQNQSINLNHQSHHHPSPMHASQMEMGMDSHMGLGHPMSNSSHMGTTSDSMSPSANIPITLEEYLKVGSVVKATTIHGVTYQGEVMAVDNKTRLVFIAVAVGSCSKSSDATSDTCSAGDDLNSTLTNSNNNSSSSPRHHDVIMLNLNRLKDLATVKEAPESNQLASLAYLRIPDAEQRFKSTVAKKMKKVDCIGIGVSPEAQALFDKLKNQFECSWSGTSIKLDTLKVTIKEPYYASNCVTGDSKNSVSHVRNLVEQFWRPLSLSQTQSQSNTHSMSQQKQQQQQSNNNNKNSSSKSHHTVPTASTNQKKNSLTNSGTGGGN